MPNHVTNILMPIGNKQRIKEMLESIKNEEFGLGTVDFKKIIPMPEDLNISSGSETDRGLKLYSDFVRWIYERNPAADVLNIPKEIESAYIRKIKTINESEWALGRQAFYNIQKYGYPTWYEWCFSNWGTKWNAYGYVNGEDYSRNNRLCFQTAWEAPHKIIKKLSEIYPKIVLGHYWADEDIGYNCGQRLYYEGILRAEYIPEKGECSFNLAADILGINPKDYGYWLNKTATEYININNEKYDVVEIMGVTGLFTNERLDSSEIPKEMYKYDLRHSDDGQKFVSIENHVTVNHGGTFLTKAPIDLGKDGYISFIDETEPNFIGITATMSDLINNRIQIQEKGEKMDLC